MKKYHKERQETSPVLRAGGFLLEELMLQGAKHMIEQALSAEIESIQEVHPQKPYRNGYSKLRKVTTPAGTLNLQAPRLRVPFESQILARYQRTSKSFDHLMPQLYLHGLSSNDFKACFQSTLGEDAPLSPSSITRMKAQWERELAAWRKEPLDSDYLYVWVDGIYPQAGSLEESLCVLVAIGVNARGEKKLLALESGYRESYESWKSFFHHLKERGLRWIGLLIGDGIKTLWQALREVYPQTKKQRCWVHKMRNILDKVPQNVHDEVLEALRGIYHAPTLQQAQGLIKTFILRYGSRYPKAVSSLEEAKAMLLTYFQFPKEHWKSIKTTNPIESAFAPVRNRLNTTKRLWSRNGAVAMVFELLRHQQTRFRRINKYKLVLQTMESMNPKLKLRVAA